MDSLNNNDTKHVGSAGSNRAMSHKKSESPGIGSLMDPRRKSWMVEERSYIKCSPPVKSWKIINQFSNQIFIAAKRILRCLQWSWTEIHHRGGKALDRESFVDFPCTIGVGRILTFLPTN